MIRDDKSTRSAPLMSDLQSTLVQDLSPKFTHDSAGQWSIACLLVCAHHHRCKAVPLLSQYVARLIILRPRNSIAE